MWRSFAGRFLVVSVLLLFVAACVGPGSEERADESLRPTHDLLREMGDTDPASDRLWLPVGAERTLYLDLANGSHLMADRWSFGGDARLEVTIHAEGEPSPHEALVVGAPPSDDRLALTKSGIVRLQLRSVAAGKGKGQAARAGISLERPRIVAPPPVATEDLERKSSPPPSVSPQKAGSRPNIVLYLVDTLQADHLGCYGYARDTSPAIDAFAREAVVFENAIAQSSWTRAAVASILTGLWPPIHGANKRSQVLDSDAVTLQELLREHGYRTAALVSNPNIDPKFGFDQGFDDFIQLGDRDAEGTEVVEAALRWLDERPDPSQPFFLLVHTMDPHAKYDPPSAYRQRLAPQVPEGLFYAPGVRVREQRPGRQGPLGIEDVRALYDAEIAFNDDAFRALRRGLEERGLYQDAVLGVLSDHGEEFLEHGWIGHGKELFRESMRVPLVLRLGRATVPGRVRTPTQHIDLLPTLIEAAGLEGAVQSGLSDRLRGRSLVHEITSARPNPEAGDDELPIFTYLHLDGAPRVALRRGRWKLMLEREASGWGRPRLFDLARDPEERTNLADERPILVGYLQTLIEHRLADDGHRLEVQETPLDDALKKRLEALGYTS